MTGVDIEYREKGLTQGQFNWFKYNNGLKAALILRPLGTSVLLAWSCGTPSVRIEAGQTRALAPERSPRISAQTKAGSVRKKELKSECVSAQTKASSSRRKELKPACFVIGTSV